MERIIRYEKTLNELYGAVETNDAVVGIEMHHSRSDSVNNSVTEGISDPYEDLKVLPLLKTILQKHQEYCILNETAVTKRHEKSMQNIYSLVKIGTSALKSLNFYSTYLNEVVKNDPQWWHTLSQRNNDTLPVNRSVHKKFVELVALMAKLCNFLDQYMEILGNNQNSIDWEAVINAMKAKNEAKNDSLLIVSRFLRDSKELISSIKEMDYSFKEDFKNLRTP